MVTKCYWLVYVDLCARASSSLDIAKENEEPIHQLVYPKDLPIYGVF